MANENRDLIHMTLKDGLVVIETRPDLAPKHVAQIKQLIGEGKYDGVVINTQIIGSNNLIVYKSFNGKQISENVSRLFISKDHMSDNKAEFTAMIEFEPEHSHDVKFRASIIEQHKEVESDQLFAKLTV